MSRWPTFELTHIHRQKGESNPIVEAAWAVLNGKQPKPSPGNEVVKADKPGFYMEELKGNAAHASQFIRAAAMRLREMGVLDAHRDTIIVATNGHDPVSPSYPIGQIPLNNSMAKLYNPDSVNPRYRIYAGREHRDFAVNDKVMATMNDHESGITNGMQGIIRKITPNGEWSGDTSRYGRLSEILALRETDEDDLPPLTADGGEYELDIQGLMNELELNAKQQEEGRGPASHIVEVEFGFNTDQPIIKTFHTAGEIATIQLAYFVTGHKMQGGQAPVIVILAHDSTRRMIFREWLYTAITRAQVKCILIYSRIALSGGISTARIKGKTLQEKIASFVAISDVKNNPLAIKVRLPEPRLIESRE